MEAVLRRHRRISVHQVLLRIIGAWVEWACPVDGEADVRVRMRRALARADGGT